MFFEARPRWQQFLIVTSAILLSFILFSTIKSVIEGERGRIKRVIYAAKRATEQENIFKCISFTSMQYADKYGNDRRSLFLIAQNIFNAYDHIIIGIRQLDISLDTDTAKAQVEATVLAKNIEKKETNIFETETIIFLIFFQKEEQEWKVIGLEFLDARSVLFPGIS